MTEIHSTIFDEEMFKRHRLHIPKHDSDEIRAAELLSNHDRRIAMQRKAMDGKTQQFKTGDLVVDKGRTTEPFEVPLVLSNETKIGTAKVHYQNGVLHVDGVFTDGKGANLLGIDLTLMTVYTPVDDVVTLVAENSANEPEPVYDEMNTEPDH